MFVKIYKQCRRVTAADNNDDDEEVDVGGDVDDVSASSVDIIVVVARSLALLRVGIDDDDCPRRCDERLGMQ